MRTKALWFLLIMTVSLTLTLACGAADEPAAESPGPPSPGVAQTTDAITPAGSGESARGAAGSETTGDQSESALANLAAPTTSPGSSGVVDAPPYSSPPEAATPVSPAGITQTSQPTSTPTPVPVPTPTPAPPTATPPPTLRPLLEVTSSKTDYETLVEINNVLTGDKNVPLHPSWLTNAPIGEWRGVLTDENGRVQSLSISRSNAWAPGAVIPWQLGNLSELRQLRIKSVPFTGSIPPELGNLTNLINLHLSGSQLTGSIPPELGNLTNLTDLTLSHNQLTGSIPPELGNLTNVSNLFLSHNQLTGIPPELGNLTNLINLHLSHNQLTGIPRNWAT